MKKKDRNTLIMLFVTGVALVVDYIVLAKTVTTGNIGMFVILNLVVPLVLWSFTTVVVVQNYVIAKKNFAYALSSVLFTSCYYVATLRLPLESIILQVKLLKIIHIQSDATFTSVMMTLIYTFCLMQLICRLRQAMSLQRKELL